MKKLLLACLLLAGCTSGEPYRNILPEDLYAVLNEELQAEFLYDLMAARRTGGRAVSAFSKPLLIRD